MSIATAIQNAQQKVADAYTAISNKGGTLPATQNLSNMPTAIGTISTGGAISSLTITPTTSQQTITASGGVDGYSPITVNAVTSSIDANIQAGNIKSGVTILGVSGSVTPLAGETRSVAITSTSGNTFTPSSGKNGITSITVTPTNQAKTITPTTSSQSITVPSGYSGFGTLTVNAVTSSIDANITAGNIKKDVTILGVTGTYEPSAPPITDISEANYIVKNDYSVELLIGYNYMGNKYTLPLFESIISNYDALDSAYKNNTTIKNVNLSGLKTINADYVLYQAFQNCTGLTSINLSNLTSITNRNIFEGTFYGCSNITGALDLSSLTTVEGSNAFKNTFYGCSNITSVDLSALTTLTYDFIFQDAFRNCTSIVSVDMSSLPMVENTSTLSGMFYGCTSLTSVNLSSLMSIDSGTSIMGSMFYGCTSLTSVSFPVLTTLGGTKSLSDMFYGCTALTTVNFPALTTIGSSTVNNNGQFRRCFKNSGVTSISFPELTAIYCTGYNTGDETFYDNNSIEKMYFPKLNTITYRTGATSMYQEACKNIFLNCSSLTELHFGAANQAAIEATAGYSTAWGRGAGNVTIYFDL